MATVNIPISGFNELCRICGSKTSALLGLHIFEREGSLRQIYKKINACLPIQVHNSDKLPKMVCEECVYKLDALFEFRELSIKTDYELNSMLKDLYVPVCTETITMPMDTLICAPSNDQLIRQGVEVDVATLEASSTQLEEIVIAARISENTALSVKDEVQLLKPDDKKITEVILTHDEASHHGSDSDGTQDPLSVAADSLTSIHNIHVTHIRSLDAIEELKTDPQSATEYLVDTDQQPWFFCNICGKPFDSSQEFQAHCEIHWKKCDVCGISCSNDESLLCHLRDSHPEMVTQESSVSTTEVQLEEPKVEVEKKDPPKSSGSGDMKTCPECGKEYKTNYKLAEHMRKHTGEKPYKCSVCEKAFRSKIGLAQHEAKHTGQYDYTCSTCGKGFQCKSYLIVHQRVHSDVKPYPCSTCGRHFKSKQSLLDHQNRHLGVKPYLCETCGRGFITKGLCKSHQKVHSGTDNRQYPCSVCNKLFVSKSYLATHLRIHTGEKPFMCEVCGKGFLTRVDLRIHSTMHTGEKSFVCEVCGKAFARRDALRCHKRSHTGERPYRCDICGQGFTQFSPMAIHKRLHTGERPYSCDICGKTFVSRSTMMSHRKKHTN